MSTYIKKIGAGTRMQEIIPYDHGFIPYPGDNKFTREMSKGQPFEAIYRLCDAGTGLGTIVDATAEFTKWGIEAGDLVYYYGTPALFADRGCTYVTEVVSDTQINTSGVAGLETAGLASGGQYTIFKVPSQPKPCRLNLAQNPPPAPASTIAFMSAGKDVVVVQPGFAETGTLMPQVIAVLSTGTGGGKDYNMSFGIW